MKLTATVALDAAPGLDGVTFSVRVPAVDETELDVVVVPVVEPDGMTEPDVAVGDDKV